MGVTKILVDTDIGTDGDDAICLAFLLSRPDCEVVGATTVGMDAPVRAQMVESLCRHFGQPDVPVAAGADQPYFANHYWSMHRVCQAPMLETWPATREYARGEALPLMRRVIRENPGEVTLLALGPLTNAGMLAASDPETAGMLKSVWCVAGLYDYDPSNPVTECNVMLDPVSAGAVFHHHWPELRMFSGNSTRHCSLAKNEIEQRFESERMAPVVECSRLWLATKPGAQGMLDPFAGAALLDPDLVGWWQPGRVGVILHDRDLKHGFRFDADALSGRTTLDPRPDGQHLLARDCDDGRTLNALFDALS